MSWATIKDQKVFEPGIELVFDPAEHARVHKLVGNHTPEARRTVGAWRWPVVSAWRDIIKGLLVDAERAIDFGGTAGPIGYGAVVVDREESQPNGLRALYDVPGQVDVLFTSHTLEHIVDIELVAACIARKVKHGGHLIIHVPSYRAQHLRADRWAHHEQTFSLEADGEPFTAIDTLFGRWFDWRLRDHAESQLILIGERK